MPYLNRIELMGNLGGEPEEYVTTSGKVVLRLSLATTKRYKDAAGERKEQTDWHNLVAWGRTAELLKSLGLYKGQALYVAGEIHHSQYTKKDGTKGTSSEVNVSDFQLLSPKPAAERRAASPYAEQRAEYAEQRRERAKAKEPEPEAPEFDDDDLPF